MIDIETNLAAINLKIQELVAKNAAPGAALTLVAVSKKQPLELVERAIAAGQRHFAENYLQEAVDKISEIGSASAIWHFIGAIQSNKTRQIAEYFDWVHTVDRLKIAQRLSEQRPESMPELNVCIQVNIDRDPAKAGAEPESAGELARAISELPRLKLRGLMTITAADKSASESEQSFKAMHELFLSLQRELGSKAFDTLSMGMSSDWPIALSNGANMMRIGTAIFGSRL